MDNPESSGHTPHNTEKNEKGKNTENKKLYNLGGLTEEELLSLSRGLELLNQDYLDQMRGASDYFKAELDQERKERLFPLMDKVNSA